ncbi:y4mF family transcriptional regulator [Chitinophaga skermanii]|uniref:Y4mF family transcriptional regulator n=1 Tax=Chitinophaga skermanii TaxID=331697 RepID=A0A327QVQ8_9BACT|nr:helix-turn-helix domain-containing protein [Chitinophaga skermanii]RAJ08470.1 y4mF family transcriptional regulator [Chitinophaga skermanii]
MRKEMEELGHILRERRVMLGLLQPQLADIAGISTRTIQLVEQGKGNPSLTTIMQLATPLGLQLALTLNDPTK